MTAMPNALRTVAPRLVAIVAAVVSLAPAAVAAQDRRLSARLDAETAATVGRLVDSVRLAGLPADPLVAVALEGAGRRASSERIVAAVREYAAALGSARRTLGGVAQSDEIVSAAGVIVAGVAPAVVGGYRAARPDGSLTVPFVVLADLIARGVPVDSAAGALGDALRNGAGDDDLSELRRRVERDILAGAKPATAMSIRTRALPGGRSPGLGPRRPASPRIGRPGGW
jgi:hypothetical protein